MIEIADRVICPSRYEYDNFIRYFPYFSEKVFLIENSIESFPFKRDKVQDIIKKHGIKKGDIVSHYVGRLERIKGADVLIHNIPRMLSRHRRLKIFVIGKTLERNIYIRLMKAKKRFPRQLFYIRYLEKDKLFQYYYLSDIYINTSLSESFSLSTHESALCDNALLLNSLPIFDKFKQAALYFSNHNDNGHEFLSKFENLIKDKQLRQRLSKRSLRIAKDFLANNRSKENLARFFKGS